MTATVAFYRRIGVIIPNEAIWMSAGKGHHAEIRMANGLVLELDSLELIRSYDPSWQGEGHGCNVICFSMPSRDAVDSAYGALLSAGHRGHLAPFDAFWGARYAVVLDPDGNQVGLMSPVEDAFKEPGPVL